jgi:short-subunit dehydrogenase
MDDRRSNETALVTGASYGIGRELALSFSEALSEELRGTGVTVTALCPGPTASGFQARAAMQHARLFSRPAMDTRRVAETGSAAMMGGKAVAVPGLLNRLLAQSVRISPRFLVRRIAGWLNATAS